MTSQLVPSLLALAGLALGISPVSAQALFKEVSKDFGGAPRGTILTHNFTLTNNTSADLHVASLRTSCGCASATVGSAEVAPGQSTDVTVKIDTNKFSGQRSFTIYVLIDRPFLQESQLIASAVSRGDLTVQPSQLAFGTVKKGSTPEASLTVQHYGSTAWSITGIENENGFLLPKVENVTQFEGQNAFRLTVKLRPDIPAGNWHADIYLKTNDPATPRIFVPISVEILSNLTASPSELALGSLKAGSHTEKRVVVRGLNPFKIVRVEGEDAQCQVNLPPPEARTVHVLTVSLTAGNGGDINRRFKIVTDLPGDESVEFKLQAQVTP